MLEIRIMKVQGLARSDTHDLSDPYVVILSNKKKEVRSYNLRLKEELPSTKLVFDTYGSLVMLLKGRVKGIGAILQEAKNNHYASIAPLATSLSA